ncbi:MULTISPECIES: isocitrate lyase/PEP mutase family protein [Cupriavidus]|uniref:Isocitrate lyase/PEP mutase family protein n=1 Tax=Cupriavidus pauculus TaxID=82633 RepID=A0A5P2H1G5_9BURK|nr:isocitrate lyase/PEP mutase family protein [Cupriavidus pauculus]QET01648.1 isocitrate lyase/PEP mutase family protein [Cupriavidus pauculus]
MSEIFKLGAGDALRGRLETTGFLPMPSVWDGLSARVATQAGFDALFVSGLCVSAARFGGPDLDLISFAELLDALVMVREAAPAALVMVDGDHGFGNALNVERTVRAFGRAGAAAIMIEDKASPRVLDAQEKLCLPRKEAVIKVRAAVEASRESGMLVLARTDCRPTLGLDEALARIALFVEAGADIVLLDAPASEEEIVRSVAAARGRPAFGVVTGEPSRPPYSGRHAQSLGLRLGTFPFSTLAPAMHGMREALAQLASEEGRPYAFDRAALRHVLGYDAYATRAEAFTTQQTLVE